MKLHGLFWLLFACALGLTGHAYAASPPNLLPNGGFEEGMTGWTPGMDAAGKACGATVAIDEAQHLAGAKSVKLMLPGKGTISVHSPAAPVEAGRDIFLTARYRSEGFSKPGKNDIAVSYYLAWVNAEGKTFGSQLVGGFSNAAQAQWVGVGRLITVPKDAVAVQLSFGVVSTEGSTPSTLWLDQVQVRRWDGEVKPGGLTRNFNVCDGYYMTTVFRVVADDTTKKGLAVIANPKFVKQPTYLSAFLYLRDLKPGTYRITYRLKVAELPPADKPAVTLSSESNAGALNSRTVLGGEFTNAGVYQDFSLRFALTPWAGYGGFGATWHGNSIMWADTITVTEEEIYTDEQVKELFN
ncbi:MAG: hypothetical protein ACYDBB_23620 [Armatimonadota bacterium]